ncbi:hypothetical protein FRC12_014860 [Ceratobasidium sp. 428]|nr:hypothetical protein FRC12_014860 [Ceratobasidium sp. 428]
MSMLLPRSYSTGSKSRLRDSPEQTDLDLIPETSEPQFMDVQVQTQALQSDDAIKDQDENEPAGDKKAVDPDPILQPPLNAENQYEQKLREAQEEASLRYWARRRKAGYDDYGAEMTKDARIWRAYVRETDRTDEELVDGWNKSLDVLLISRTNVFKIQRALIYLEAALFSAISTAFVGISTQSLQQNPADTSAQTLITISETLLAISNGGVTNSSSSAADQESAGFKPPGPAVIVNALWFLSLSLSVAVSLIAMLAKEWCHAFMSSRSGETYERARIRQRRWNEIERLKMIDVLTLLPLLMHLALCLCIYLWNINIAVAIPVVVITSISTLIYVSTVVHSLTVEHCPYTTASSKLVKSYIEAWFSSNVSFFGAWTKRFVEYLTAWITILFGPGQVFLSKVTRSLRSRVPSYSVQPQIKNLVVYISSQVRKLGNLINVFRRNSPEPLQPIDLADSLAHDQRMDTTTSQMLSWLLRNCHDSKITDLVVYSLAGAEPWLPRLPLLENDALSIAFRCLDKCFEYNLWFQAYVLRPNASPDAASLCLRALQFLLGYYSGHGFVLFMEPIIVMRNTWAQDFYPRRLGGMAFRTEDDGLAFRVNPPSSSDDIVAFSSNFSFMIATKADPKPKYHDLSQDASVAMIEAHIGRHTVLHSATLIAMVRQITNRLCLPTEAWESLPQVPYRLCSLLLRLYSHSEGRDRDQDLQFAIALALTAAVINFGSYPGWIHPPDYGSSSRAEQFVAYHSRPRLITYRGKQLSLRNSRYMEIGRLFEFSLAGLLELPLAHQLTSGDLDAWVTAFYQAHDGYFSDYVYIHSIPRTFTNGIHAARVVAQYVKTYLLSNNFVENHAGWQACFQALCGWSLRIQDEHVDDHGVIHSALLELFCADISPEQQRCLALLSFGSHAGCSKACFESISAETLQGLLSVSLSGSKFIAPAAMCELWALTTSMLQVAGESPTAEHLLGSLVADHAPVPKTVDELGILRQWFPHIQTMCIDSPQELNDSGLLSSLTLYYYDLDHYLDRVVLYSDERDSSESGDAFRVANLFQELQNKCNEMTIRERREWEELPFGERTEMEDD